MVAFHVGPLGHCGRILVARGGGQWHGVSMPPRSLWANRSERMFEGYTQVVGGINKAAQPSPAARVAHANTSIAAMTFNEVVGVIHQ